MLSPMNLRIPPICETASPNYHHHCMIGYRRIICATCGPSGIGKSTVAAILGSYFIEAGLGCCVIGSDNYPHLPPRDNEQQRKYLGTSSNGERALRNYLGTEQEIDFKRMDSISELFKKGAAGYC